MTEGKPGWMKLKSSEVEKIILEFHRQGFPPAKIGLVLRDKHGIPKAKIFGKRITKILKEKNERVKEEKEIIKQKIENLEKHITKNKKDYPAKRSLTKKLWVVKK